MPGTYSLWPAAFSRRFLGLWLALIGSSLLSPIAQATTSAQLRIVEPKYFSVHIDPPIKVKIDLNGMVPGSLRIHLNGKDITSQFTITSTSATASLTEAQGLRTAELAPGASRREKVRAYIEAGNLLSTSAKRKDRWFFFNTITDSSLFYVFTEPGENASDTIPVEGGSVELTDVGSVDFAPNSFTQPTLVALEKTSEPASAQLYTETTVIFDASARANFEFRVNVGGVQPALPATVTLAVPPDYLATLTDQQEIRVFAEHFSQGPNSAMRNVEMLPERFASIATSVTVSVEPWFFTTKMTPDGTYEAVLTVGATAAPLAPPATPVLQNRASAPEAVVALSPDAEVSYPSFSDIMSLQAAAAADTCAGETLSNPIDPPMASNSPFGPRPGVGASDYHYGTDYPAPTGTPVLAMADGTVAIPPESPIGTGWGRHIVLKHKQDPNQITHSGITVYAHLESWSVANGAFVTKGTVIGISDSTGGVTGPHLHVEYAPNCQVFNNCTKQNVESCIGAQAKGSITVSDNGSIADDAFNVSINGVSICSTQIGAANTCAIGALNPGVASLTLTVTIAPDNAGTFLIVLGDGLTFSDGSASRSGSLPQGASASYSITIPSATP